jgi:hypothetical protein
MARDDFQGPDYDREEWERNYGREGRHGRDVGPGRGYGPDFTREEWRGGERGRQWEGGYEGGRYGGAEFRGEMPEIGARRREPGYDIAPPYGGRASESPWSGTQGGFTSGERYGSEYGGRENFAGRGPKGYRRSDERVNEDVCERLTRHPAIDASGIEVRVENGEVTLSGTVNDRRSKRLAEDVVEDVSGVTDVKNELKVSQGATGRGADRESEVATAREGRGGREGRSPQEGTEVRRATRSSTSGGTTRS